MPEGYAPFEGKDRSPAQPGQIGAAPIEMNELATDPAAPGSDGARLYTRDNGAGKTQLCVRFASGAVQVLSTQP